MSMMAMMAMMATATAGDCQRGRAEVGEGSDGGGKDYGKQPVSSSAEAIIYDYDHAGGDDDEINNICNGCISDTCKLCTRSRLRRTAQLFSHCPWNSLEGSLTPR